MIESQSVEGQIRRDPLKAVSQVLPTWVLPTSLRVTFQLLNGIFFQYGWLRSLRNSKSVDAQGRPLPWITYPAIDFLCQLDLSRKSVFEWGSGQSTLFWAARAKRIVSIETDVVWHDYVSAMVPSNCELILVPRDRVRYAGIIETFAEKFDVIMIDGPGNFRHACSEASLKYLKPGGVIILDNSDQSPLSAQTLRDFGLIEIDFTGFAPGQGYATTTSIYFDREYSFKPLEGVQPRKSVAQPNGIWDGA